MQSNKLSWTVSVARLFNDESATIKASILAPSSSYLPVVLLFACRRTVSCKVACAVDHLTTTIPGDTHAVEAPTNITLPRLMEPSVQPKVRLALRVGSTLRTVHGRIFAPQLLAVVTCRSLFGEEVDGLDIITTRNGVVSQPLKFHCHQGVSLRHSGNETFGLCRKRIVVAICPEKGLFLVLIKFII